MNFSITTTALAEWIGVAGFCLYVLNYTLLTFRIVAGHALIYFTLNLIAASMVLIGLTYSFNLAAAMIQVFWISMSLVGIILNLKRFRAESSEPRGRAAHSIKA